MQLNKPSLLYQQALNTGNYQPDAAQYKAITYFDTLHQALSQLPPPAPTVWGKLSGVLDYFRAKSTTPTVNHPIQGIYLWGGTGRGKTWLMDLFFQSLPGERKLRLHFHRFMWRIHEELTQLQGYENPLNKIADDFKAQTDVLCFDEFFVSDIADAMILATLLEALFIRGITLVVTSNIPPDSLYLNGLQRERFLPAITLIKRYCNIMNVDLGTDYRFRALDKSSLYLTPLNEQTREMMTQLFMQLAGTEGDSDVMLEINHHSMAVISVAGAVLAIDFATLCAQARSQLDYIALSALYHTILLHNVRRMGPEDESTARRFLALIDEFYERRVKLVISADAVMSDLYYGQHLKFEYQRCLSRLQEMQSEAWLQLAHLP
jgi:cell division protein ZapE